MSYLDRLKAKQAPNPFEGFAGAMREAVSADTDPFDGFEGDEGIGVCGNQPSPPRTRASSFLERLQTRSKSEVFRSGGAPGGLDAIPQTYPPQSPSKPSKVLADLADLHEPQADLNRCHVCGEREEPGRWFVAVLSTKPDERHWLHHGECHVEHSRRCAERRHECG